MKLSIPLAVLALLLLVSASAYADPITFSYIGFVTSVQGNVPSGVICGADILLGFTFDSDAIDSVYPDSPTRAEYRSVGPPYGIQAIIDGNLYANHSGVDVGVFNDDYGADSFGGANHDWSWANPGSIWIAMAMADYSGTGFSDESLPLTPPDPQNFPYGRSITILLVNTDGSVEYQILGTVTEAVPIPEPSTLTLLGLGMVGLIGAGRRCLGESRQSEA